MPPNITVINEKIKQLLENMNFTTDPVYNVIYEDCTDEIMKKVLASWHSRLNQLFSFMNQKNNSNNDYNANESRERYDK